jgi:hypothetical protein
METETINDRLLTQHFRLSEFTHSDTARRLGISNEPGHNVVLNLTRLCQHVLEPARRHLRTSRKHLVRVP